MFGGFDRDGEERRVGPGVWERRGDEEGGENFSEKTEIQSVFDWRSRGREDGYRGRVSEFDRRR